MSFDFTALADLPWLPLAWGLLVGLVFSLVGAAGGILASFGLISVIGLTDPNQVKPMAQALTLVTPLVAVPAYYRQCRLVIPLAVVLGVGGIAGAVIGSSLSVRYLADIHVFRPVFAFLVLGIAIQLAWSLRPGGTPKAHTARAVAAFEGLIATAARHARSACTAAAGRHGARNSNLARSVSATARGRRSRRDWPLRLCLRRWAWAADSCWCRSWR